MTKWTPSVCLLSSLSQTAEVYNSFAYFFAYLFLLCSCIGIKIQGTGVFSLDNALKYCLSFAWNLSDYHIPIFYFLCQTTLRHSMTRTRLMVSEFFVDYKIKNIKGGNLIKCLISMLSNLAETLHRSAKLKKKQVAKIWGL